MDRPFERILVANRGEIACRIMEVAAEMDMATVGIYSDADSGSIHASMADLAVRIGGNTPAETYLDMDKIISIALQNGVQAIHPGYGFLSENAEFAQKCADHNIAFIGPSSKVIEQMGSKSAAKTIMQKAGVPVVPGYEGTDQSLKTLKAEAKKIGVPFMIKATHGGGGRGMRIVRDMNDFESLLKSAQSEAKSAFGNDNVLLEKYIENPRHIEVQIMGFANGDVVHFYERDCSVQRRHQKVIEEAPAPNLDEKVREKILKSAVKAGKAVGYKNAGTVEFLLAETGEFYFMEMNTRLQVEHPVTEEVTDTSLIELQFMVAAGWDIEYPQQEVECEGHSLEVRLYAEDTLNGFVPSIGHIEMLEWPEDTRIDTGVKEGSYITPYYDAMMAKLITWGETREDAIEAMLTALSELRLLGVKTNAPFLQKILMHEKFMLGEHTTHFLQDEEDDILAELKLLPASALFVATQHILTERESALENEHFNLQDPTSPWNECDGWRMNGFLTEKFNFEYLGETYPVLVTYKEDELDVELPENVTDDEGNMVGDVLSFDESVYSDGGQLTVYADGIGYSLCLKTLEYSNEGLMADVETSFKANMPGVITKILTKKGQKVKQGDALMVMEAMKMEQTFTAPKDGMVENIFYKEGEQVELGAQLLTFQV